MRSGGDLRTQHMPSTEALPDSLSMTSSPACSVIWLPPSSGSLCAGAGSQQIASSQHVPATSFLVFDAAPSVDGVSSRIRELSATLAAAPELAMRALTDGEAASLDAMLSRCCLYMSSLCPSLVDHKVPSVAKSVMCCTASRVVALASTSSLTEADYELINKLLAWPATALFPALDLARLMALNAVASQHLAANAGSQAVGAANGQHLVARQCLFMTMPAVQVVGCSKYVYNKRCADLQMAVASVLQSAEQQRSRSLRRISRQACA